MKEPNGTVNASALGAFTIDEVVALRLEHGRAYVHQAEGDQGGSLKDWNMIALTDLKGATLERYYYSPYGQLEVSADTTFGDYDGDGFVDSGDADDLCTTGCACTFTASASGDCRVFDFDCDGDLDETDQDTLRSLYQGLSSDMQSRRIPTTTFSPAGNPFTHQGLVLDADIGSYQNRLRQFNQLLMRFEQRDPPTTGVLAVPVSSKRVASGVCTQTNTCVFQVYTPSVVRAGSGYEDGPNLYLYLRSSPVSQLDPRGLSTRCGDVSCACCGSGDQDWPVHGDSARARLILLGGDGCVTLLIPKGIFCTGSCQEIKDWEAARDVPILDHECCHACEFEDHGLCGYRQSWIPGDLTGYCNDHSVEATPDW